MTRGGAGGAGKLLDSIIMHTYSFARNPDAAMPRPSRNQDRLLIAAGSALLPESGCAGLRIRQVCDAAGVNPGMFHYHFRSREAFLRAVMQSTYEELFQRLTLEAAQGEGPLERLRAGLRLMGRFVRDHRRLFARVLTDAFAGEAVAREFLRDNLPRHLGVLEGLIVLAQREGRLRPVAPRQALGVCAGSIAMPILAGGAVADALPRAPAREIADTLLTDTAIDERIDIALAGLAAPGRAPAKPDPSPPRRARARRPKGHP